MNVTSTLKGVRGQTWLCVTTFETETAVSKASRRSARAYHLDIRGRFGGKDRRKSNNCSAPLTSYSMLFIAGKKPCNIHFRAYGKSGNLESGIWNRKRNRNRKRGKVGNTETSSALKSLSIYNLRWRLISYQLLRHYQDIFKLGNWLEKGKRNYYSYSWQSYYLISVWQVFKFQPINARLANAFGGPFTRERSAKRNSQCSEIVVFCFWQLNVYPTSLTTLVAR